MKVGNLPTYMKGKMIMGFIKNVVEKNEEILGYILGFALIMFLVYIDVSVIKQISGQKALLIYAWVSLIDVIDVFVLLLFGDYLCDAFRYIFLIVFFLSLLIMIGMTCYFIITVIIPGNLSCNVLLFGNSWINAHFILTINLCVPSYALAIYRDMMA